MSDPEVWAKYDALGEDGVRLRIAQKAYNGHNLQLAQEWLRRREDKRSSRSDRRKDTRDNIAAIAAIVAAVAATIGAIASMVMLFF